MFSPTKEDDFGMNINESLSEVREYVKVATNQNPDFSNDPLCASDN
jgi:hypothetical protein